MPNKVSIVILNWNGWRNTCLCLRSLHQHASNNFEVLVVDNASTDDSVPRIRAAFPDIRIIETKCNLGFAGGCNTGIRHALAGGADFVWLLNNDTLVDAKALDMLVDKARADRDLGAIGSAIYFADQRERLQAWGGGYVNFWLGRSRHFLHAVPDESVEFITGASMLIRREAIRYVGLLDERFFMYWEDADFCFRLRKAGWKLGVAGDSRIWHKGSDSVGKESARLDHYFNASASAFFRKHAPIPFVPISVGGVLRVGKRIVKGDWMRARAVIAAVTEQPAGKNRIVDVN